MSVQSSTTTVQLRRETVQKLLGKKVPFEDKSIDDVINRVLNLEGEVFIEPIYIDGEFAKSSDHTILFQVGDLPPRYYLYSKGVMEETVLPKMKMEVVQVDLPVPPGSNKPSTPGMKK